MDLRAIIQDFLVKGQMMNLGTSHWTKPWVTPVYYASDMNMNLYWLSRKSRRHSEEIRRNSRVAGSIVIPVKYGDKVRGLQFEGEAHELSKEDAEAGRNIYKSKYWIVEDRTMTAIEGKDEQACYQLRPTKFLLYDEVCYPDNPAQILEL